MASLYSPTSNPQHLLAERDLARQPASRHLSWAFRSPFELYFRVRVRESHSRFRIDKSKSTKSFDDIYAIGWLLTQWIFRGQSDSKWQLSMISECISDLVKLVGPEDFERPSVRHSLVSLEQNPAELPDKRDREKADQ